MLKPYWPMRSPANRQSAAACACRIASIGNPCSAYHSAAARCSSGTASGSRAPELEAQEIGEQLVIAEPRPLAVDREDERVRILELEQDPLRAGRPERADRRAAVHALEDRGAEQEPPHRLGLALQDLGEQVVRHGPLAARELGDESLRVGVTGERERREPQSRDPPFGPGLERCRRRCRTA